MSKLYWNEFDGEDSWGLWERSREIGRGGKCYYRTRGQLGRLSKRGKRVGDLWPGDQTFSRSTPAEDDFSTGGDGQRWWGQQTEDKGRTRDKQRCRPACKKHWGRMRTRPTTGPLKTLLLERSRKFQYKNLDTKWIYFNFLWWPNDFALQGRNLTQCGFSSGVGCDVVSSTVEQTLLLNQQKLCFSVRRSRIQPAKLLGLSNTTSTARYNKLAFVMVTQQARWDAKLNQNISSF